MVITTLAHHIDLAWMYEAYRQTRKSGAVGVDKVTAEEYAADLETNLMSLLDRFKSGTYFAPPVRRVEIPKGDGSRRGRSGYRPSRTRCCSELWRWSSRRCTSRTSVTARTGFGPADRRTTRSKLFGKG